MSQDYNEYYKKKLEEGQEYQDFVAGELFKLGIVLSSYSSRKYQYEKGESTNGIEIKCQKDYKKYGTLCIETHEKAHPDNPKYVPSGIYRGDNSWLFITGDYETIYIFSHVMLRGLNGRYDKYTKDTSKGYKLPIKEADKYCAKRIDIKKSKQVEITF
jgi:hypothetical protein